MFLLAGLLAPYLPAAKMDGSQASLADQRTPRAPGAGRQVHERALGARPVFLQREKRFISLRHSLQ